jgi:hypothetical protein
MTANLWDDRDFPILQAVQRLTIETRTTELDPIVAEVGALPREVVSDSLIRLHEAGYIVGYYPPSAAADPSDWWDVRLAERGLRKVGQWPSSDEYAAMVTALDRFSTGRPTLMTAPGPNASVPPCSTAGRILRSTWVPPSSPGGPACPESAGPAGVQLQVGAAETNDPPQE